MDEQDMQVELHNYVHTYTEADSTAGNTLRSCVGNGFIPDAGV